MDFDVIIVGSGLVGASLAVALAKFGLQIAVVEARPPHAETSAWDSRVYAISPGSAAFLGDCGVWDELDATRICQVEEMHIFGDDLKSELQFCAYDAGLRELAFIVENRALQLALWRALHQHDGIEVIAPTQCADMKVDGSAAQLQLADGRNLHGRLIVGADGADSWVRARAAIEVRTRPYDQMAVVANFNTSKAHRGVAFQWFRHGGVLALLPMPGNRVSMVWSLANDGAAELLQLPPMELAARVAAGSGGAVGEMEVITPAAAFPLRLQRVSKLVLPRLAVIGDAAHNVHPLAGQGVNLGFRDARELARVLAQRGAQNDCGDYYLLRRYERARREDIAAMRFATDALQRLFYSDSTALAGLRNFGLRLTNRQAHLKNLLVQQAVG